jgi:hypothetical protein
MTCMNKPFYSYLTSYQINFPSHLLVHSNLIEFSQYAAESYNTILFRIIDRFTFIFRYWNQRRYEKLFGTQPWNIYIQSLYYITPLVSIDLNKHVIWNPRLPVSTFERNWIKTGNLRKYDLHPKHVDLQRLERS